jgi:hypothetical protein
MSELFKKIEPLEKKRKDLFSQYSKNITIAVILAIIIIGLFILLLESEFFFILFLLIIPIFFVMKAVGLSNKFKETIKDELVHIVLEDKFDDVYYDRHQSIPQSVIDQTGLVKRPDRFSGEDYIKGTYKGVSFEVSDVNLKERQEHVDSKGNRTVTYPTYFKGRWYIYKFPKTFNGTLKICEKHPHEARGLERVETESIAFNKKFKLYASDKQYAFFHLTPIMMEKLLELEQLHRGSIYFYYTGNELHIGVNDSQDYMEIPFRKIIDEKAMKAFEGDVDLIPAIINELKLTSDKFK